MAMRKPVSVEELGFSHNTELALRQMNIQWDTELEEAWKNCGIHEIEDSLSRTPCFNSLTVIEITTRFALTGTSVTQKIDEHIQYLIEKDVPYSSIRFWESLKMVLQCLPEKRYLNLSSERLQHYCNSYFCYIPYARILNSKRNYRMPSFYGTIFTSLKQSAHLLLLDYEILKYTCRAI